MTPNSALKKLLQRRHAIEPIIGSMKNHGLRTRNWLKRSEGDAIHAVQCGARHNFRLIWPHLSVLPLVSIGRFVHVATARLRL